VPGALVLFITRICFDSRATSFAVAFMLGLGSLRRR